VLPRPRLHRGDPGRAGPRRVRRHVRPVHAGGTRRRRRRGLGRRAAGEQRGGRHAVAELHGPRAVPPRHPPAAGAAGGEPRLRPDHVLPRLPLPQRRPGAGLDGELDRLAGPGEGRVGADPYLRDLLSHTTDDDYWAALDLRGHAGDIDVPMLHVSSWAAVVLDWQPSSTTRSRCTAPSAPAPAPGTPGRTSGWSWGRGRTCSATRSPRRAARARPTSAPRRPSSSTRSSATGSTTSSAAPRSTARASGSSCSARTAGATRTTGRSPGASRRRCTCARAGRCRGSRPATRNRTPTSATRPTRCRPWAAPPSRSRPGCSTSAPRRPATTCWSTPATCSPSRWRSPGTSR